MVLADSVRNSWANRRHPSSFCHADTASVFLLLMISLQKHIVQRRVTRLVKGLKKFQYEEGLIRLGLTTLKQVVN